MKSLFFNVSKEHYQRSTLLKTKTSHIQKVDISSGILFFDVTLKGHHDKHIKVDNFDRLVAICIVKKGRVSIVEEKKETLLKADEIHLFCSSKQDFTIHIHEAKESEIFVLFIADFILKRYLSGKAAEPIDTLYATTQEDTPLTQINTQPLDSISLYLVEKIKEDNPESLMQSFVGEQRVMEFMAHRFSLLDIVDKTIDKEAYEIAKRAKKYLLTHFINPPSIQELARICATNQTKLKTVFKQVYALTIYAYIQKLRLEKANILLKEDSLSIGEIAKKVGYKHQGHFSKLFFESYGIYPKELLKVRYC